MFDRGRTLRLAARHAETGKVHEALREYRQLIEADGGETFALHEAIDLHLRLGERREAARALSMLGERLASRGWRLAAIHALRRLQEIVATLPEDEQRPYRGAPRTIEQLRSLVSEQRDALAARDERAQALESAGRDVAVVELLLQMSALQPDNPVFHARLAEAHCRLGRQADALPSFRLAALALVEIGRKSDALRVLERILHFRDDAEDARLAARLYLDRGEPSDAMRAVAKLQVCVAADPESLDTLALLARAFDAMQQPERSIQVKVEMARLAKEEGEGELLRDLLSELGHAAPDDPVVRSLSGRERSLAASAPSLSVRGSFLGVTGDDLDMDVLAEARERADASVLAELSFEDLSEVWVLPVVTKEARRALDDAEAFLALRLFPKAEYVLRIAVEQDPFCAELREMLRGVLRSQGKVDAFVDETVALADLYRQRRFYGRAWTLVDEALGVAPYSEVARAFAADLPERPSDASRPDA